MPCLSCPGTDICGNAVTVYYCKLVFVTLFSTYATCNNTALLYVRTLRRKQFCIEIEVSNNVENFLNVGGAGFTCKSE